MSQSTVRALLCRDSIPLLAEDSQFPFEQGGIPSDGMPDCGQAQDGQWTRSRTRSCEDVSLSNGDCDDINEAQSR